MELTTTEERTGAQPVHSDQRQPARPDGATWIAVLFALTFLFQRISVPSISIPVTVPIACLWVGLAFLRGLVTIDPRRFLIWCLAAAVSGAMVLPQLILVASPYVSFNSWALWMVIWLPLVVRLRDRSRIRYLRTLRAVAHVGLGLAILSIAFIVSQLLGLRYYDWLADVVPHNLLVQGYVITYPITYGSPIYKSNGWIALEPSFMSFMIGVCLVSALVTRMSVAKVLVLVAGLLSTVAGSGMAVVAVYVVCLLLVGRIGNLRRYALPTLLAVGAFTTTMFGQAVSERVLEFGDPRSSTSLRATQPYVELLPYWVSDPVSVVIGQGPGSSAEIVRGLAILGLLVPSTAKVLFDYGLVGGTGLILLMIFTYVRSPEPLFALSLATSMFVLQTASQPLVICSIMLFAFWSPTPTDDLAELRPGDPDP
jgi:hypothetical protein